MRVAVENYELYNNGVLICKWFDLEDYSLEEIQEEIVEYIEENHADDDFNTDDMELFVADYEDDSGLFSGESLTEALEVQEQIDDLDEDDLKAISILVETGWASDVEDAIDKKDDIHNTGETDMEDVAYNYIEETGALGDMPESLQCYFDYSSLGRDMEINGQYHTDDNGEIWEYVG